MINTIIIGNRIAEARKKMNISQAQLAQRLFISSQAVGKWERGESMPDILTFNRLAETLGVDLNYFSESSKPAQTQSDSNPMVSVESIFIQSDKLPAGENPDGRGEKKLSWDMSQGSWVDVDFSGLKNLHDKFSSSYIQRCLFIGSDLSGLQLKGNHVESCDFSGSDLRSSHIHNSNLAKNLFKECSFIDAELSGSHINACNFSGADFTGIAFKSCSFVKNTVADAVWNRTSFIDTQFADILFEGRLEDCYFENCAFTKLTFQNSTLINTFFKNKSLKRIRFINCHVDRMTYAFLKNGKADMTGITLIQE